MPQEFQVLQCYACKTFQVGIIKKEAKWDCKMCGDKQSVQKVFHRGNGKECRLYVQELNEIRIKSENEVHSKPEYYTFPITEIEYKSKCVDTSRSKWLELMQNSENYKENTKFEDCDNSLGIGACTGVKRKLVCSEPSRRNKSKWAQFISTDEVQGVEILGKDLVGKNRNSIEENAVNNSNELISLEKSDGKELSYRKDCENLNTNNEGTTTDLKWNEFDEGQIYSENNILSEENLNIKLLTDEPRGYKNTFIRNRFNLFESEINEDIDCLLEI